MFRPKKPELPTNLRLPKQQALSESDLQFLLGEAAAKRGVTIELPFYASGRVVYMISCRLADDSNDAVWTYFRGEDPPTQQLLWRHGTGDVNLVYNLCNVEAGGAESFDASSRLTAGQSMPSLPSSSTTPPSGMNTTTLDMHSQSNPNITLRDVPSASSIAASQLANVTSGHHGKPAIMQGDLSNMQIPTLLQSIQMSKMTGCLQLLNVGTQASIYFEDGMPTHASTAESTGDSAIVETITWEEGQFHFYPNEKTAERTVKRRVDSLLMEGVALLDQNKYCKEQGLKPQSYVIRRHAQISEDEFRIALTKGAPLDLNVQKRFYGIIDNASTLLDLLRRMPMTKIEWVPLLFNMLSCGLVGLSDTAPAGVCVSPILNIAPFEIDRTAIQGTLRQITRPETCILQTPAFLYLLELEFAKCAAVGMPLAVLVFEPRLRVGDNIQQLPMQYSRELMRRIESFKRVFDGLGHFELFDYAMFLPNTNVKAAKIFAVKLAEIFGADPFIPRPMGQLALYTGIAAAPEDTHELSILLAAAKDAKKRATESGNLITVFRENTAR